jgi:hypothetical protein
MNITDYLPPPWVAWAIAAVVALVLAVVVYRTARAAWRAYRAKERPPTSPDVIEDWLTRLVAGVATAVSAQGMWRFAGDKLDLDGPVRVVLFAFIELAIIISAVRAHRNMREKYSAGLDGIAVWALACLTAVLSALDATNGAEAVFRLVAPLVAAWLWERGMRLERHRIRGTKGIHWRITPERVLVRLGLAETTDRTASEVDAQRRLTRAALAADRVAETTPGTRAHRRAIARLKREGRRMVTHTAVSTDVEQQGILMAQLGVARSIAQLADAAPAPFWVTPAELSAGSPEGNAALQQLQAWDADTAAMRALVRTELAMLTAAPADVASDRPFPSPSEPLPLTPPLTVNGGEERGADVDHEDPSLLTEPLTESHTASHTPNEENREDDREETDDRGRPNDLDNRKAEEWIRRQCRGRNGVGRRPSWTDVATRFGFSEGWGGRRVRAVQEKMSAQGYQFDDDGTVYAPRESLTEPLTDARVEQPDDDPAADDIDHALKHAILTTALGGGHTITLASANGRAPAE